MTYALVPCWVGEGDLLAERLESLGIFGGSGSGSSLWFGGLLLGRGSRRWGRSGLGLGV
jgi:hypothetical protein